LGGGRLSIVRSRCARVRGVFCDASMDGGGGRGETEVDCGDSGILQLSIPQLSVLSGRTGRIIEENAVGKPFDIDRWRSLDR